MSAHKKATRTPPVANPIQQQREQWLNRAARLLGPQFVKLEAPLPAFRVSCGFTSKGARSKAIGEAWSDAADPEGATQIFIDPRRDDGLEMLVTLTHELIHAAVGIRYGHRGRFAEIAIAFGFQRPLTQLPNRNAPVFKTMESILKRLGPYPHKALDCGGMITSGPRKQSTRYIKCECKRCGYSLRTTRKWLAVATPICAVKGCGHKQMEVTL